MMAMTPERRRTLRITAGVACLAGFVLIVIGATLLWGAGAALLVAGAIIGGFGVWTVNLIAELGAF